MIIYEDNGKIEYASAVCLGNFDGVHTGHMEIIRTLLNEAKEKNLRAVMLTFRIHPENYVSGTEKTKLITDEKTKFNILAETGLDALYLNEFDASIKNMDPEEFIKNILIEKMKAKVLVAGFNYRFGKDRKAGAEELLGYGNEYGIKVIIVPAVYYEGQIVSSTLIRDKLGKGLIEQANGMLGRRYAITGTVVAGKKRGSRIGFPTANIKPDSGIKYPGRGVYVTKTHCGGRNYVSVTNIGVNPTVGGSRTVIETHVMNYTEEMYNKEISVEFFHKIRDEIKFNSISELHSRIKADICYTEKYFIEHQED